ncbi:MAG: hypothetical protein HKM06_04615 [Spirochaetales bacterium]|nr:hypothetical protein [Spirochaetales bacterium]
MAWLFLSLILFALALLSLRLGQVRPRSLPQSSDLASVVALAKAIRGELGSGAFSQFSRLEGQAVCAAPLTSELSQTPCVWYKLTVKRQSSTLWGLRQRRVAERELSVPFQLEKDGASLPVETDGAVWSGLKTARYLRDGSEVYLNEETCVPVGSSVSVDACASDASGPLVLRRPDDNRMVFRIGLANGTPFEEAKASSDVFFQVTAAALTAAGILCGFLGALR